jgi:hypothetical protein
LKRQLEWYRELIHTHKAAPSATYLAASGVGNDKLLPGPAGDRRPLGPGSRTLNQTPDPGVGPAAPPRRPSARSCGWAGHQRRSEHSDEAWQLLKWLTTDPGQRVFALKALTGDVSTAEELQKEQDPYWSIFLAEVPHQALLDDGTTPFYTTCVDIPASSLMGKLFQETGATLDIQAELDKLAADADKCLAESKIEPMP